MSRALLSVSNKTGLLEFARGLVERGYEIVSTGGTARVLSEAGLGVTNVSAVTGFPELMDGRVKTLHPHVHGGILARRNRPDDLAAIAALGIEPIDIVAVNLYPFAETAKQPSVALDDLIEQIDIGGPSLVRAAAKNFRDVLVVVHPHDYPDVLTMIDRGPTPDFRYALMVKAFAHTAEYDQTITAELLRRGPFQPTLETADRVELSLQKIRDLRYGENPHQRAAWYSTNGAGGFSRADILQGKQLSYTNLLDLDAAVRIVLEFSQPAAAVIKHTNPCGVATGSSSADAYVRARDADSLAAFGGIVGLNRAIDLPTAEAIVSSFIEAVIAPSVEDGATPVLARKANMRVVVADFSSFNGGGVEFRSILGAMLMQERDRVTEAEADWKVVTKRAPTPLQWDALRFAWRVCAHVKSNSVIFTDPGRTLAIGAGQMSRVDAVKVAVMKAEAANVSLAGSAVASDAFFPFRDGLDAVARAGARAVVQPGGSVRDADVIAAADEHDLAMVFTGRRHFRH
jgi:phosphoribosylaminoimidazolecarboxamide formyltransferase / IMP cyclohydrolase